MYPVTYIHGRQSDLKSVGADETFPDFSRLRDLDVRNLQYIRDFETKKSMGASAPTAPASLAPMLT